jgi:hypothetical protein
LKCLLSSPSGFLFVSANTTLTNVDICVTNTSTADYYHSIVQLSEIPLPISLFGSGDYYIAISLPSGITYYGAFTL